MIIALLLSAALAKTIVKDYQERQLFYSEKENVCMHGSGLDWVNLNITLDGNFFNEVTVKTNTYCSQWGNNNANRIMTATKWSLFDGSD